MLNRLLDITAVKSKTYKKRKKQTLAQSASERQMSVQKRAFRPKSLNINARLQEDQKIREENIKMAQRLFSRKPVLDFQSLKHEYAHHKKIKNQLKKVKPRGSKFRGRHNHLPPLNASSNPESLAGTSQKHQTNPTKSVQEITHPLTSQPAETPEGSDNSKEGSNLEAKE